MMYLDSDSDMVPNSVQSIEIDLDDDLGFSNESETDSNVGNGDIECLLEQVDNLSSDECSDSDSKIIMMHMMFVVLTQWISMKTFQWMICVLI